MSKLKSFPKEMQDLVLLLLSVFKMLSCISLSGVLIFSVISALEIS